MLKLLMAGLVSTAMATAFVANATERLPVSAIYGSAAACDLYSEGGAQAVFSAGASLGRTISVDANTPEYMVVTPDEVVSFEWACVPEFVEGTTAMLLCETAGEKPEPVNVTVSEHPVEDALFYSDDAATVILWKCD